MNNIRILICYSWFNRSDLFNVEYKGVWINGAKYDISGNDPIFSDNSRNRLFRKRKVILLQ